MRFSRRDALRVLGGTLAGLPFASRRWPAIEMRHTILSDIIVVSLLSLPLLPIRSRLPILESHISMSEQ